MARYLFNAHITRMVHRYTLESINEEKDLGIFITDDLKWSTHCQQAYTRANRVLGMNMTNSTISAETKEYC